VPILPLGLSLFVLFAAYRQYKSDPLGQRDYRGLRRRAGLQKLGPLTAKNE
jgi:hypothetical protein